MDIKQVDIKRVVQRLSDLAVETRRHDQTVILVAPFGTEIHVYPDGDGVQVDVMAFVRWYNAGEMELGELARKVKGLVHLCETRDLVQEAGLEEGGDQKGA